jgi:hypothetical protein
MLAFLVLAPVAEASKRSEADDSVLDAIEDAVNP